MIELYTFATANGQRASVMLELSGLPYRGHKVDIRQGEHKHPEFLAVNPTGAIPAIVDPEGPRGSLALNQSGAIILYLAEKSGRLLPTEPRARVETLRWFMAVMTDPAPASASIFYMGMATQPPHADVVQFCEDRFIQLLKPYETRLGTADWLADEMSIADVALYPTIATRRSLVEKARLTGILRWADRLAADPAVARGMAVGA
mgnify:CR=1 FL=1